MPFLQTDFQGLLIFEPVVLEDSRGYFYESYNEKTCREAGLNVNFVQDNQAKSVYGVVRGMHYQLEPYGQAKFIRVLNGMILDVVVDIRKGSPAFGKVFSIELSAENRKQLFIPQGFAHGYSVLSETAEVFYKCDQFYHRETEGGIIFNDAKLNINWGIPADKIIISAKDRVHPGFNDARDNFQFTS